MTIFGSPWWFLALGLVAARVILVFVDRKRGTGHFDYSDVRLVVRRRSAASLVRWLPLMLEVIGLALIVVALARPQEVEAVENQRMGIDIAVVLDASGSMAAEDFRPKNRFAVAKDLIDQFIEQRVNDRIGIITFGTRAATRVPITFDHKVAREALDSAKVAENGDGTAIGTAIATAVARLRPSTARSKVMILLTDGVNNAGSIDPLMAAKLAAHYGIKIYTIGVGSQGPVPVPVRVQNRFTGEIETVYQYIRADLDEDMLKKVARETGGQYFRATDKEALQNVLSRIDKLEKSRLDAPRSRTVDELYVKPLVFGLLALGLGFLMGETRWMRLPA